jgi:hypothetical protein
LGGFSGESILRFLVGVEGGVASSCIISLSSVGSAGRFFGESLEGSSRIGGFTQGRGIEGVLPITFFVGEVVLEDLRNGDSCSGSWSVDAAACNGFFGVSLFGNSRLGAGLRGDRWVVGVEADEDAAASFAAARLPFIIFVRRSGACSLSKLRRFVNFLRGNSCSQANFSVDGRTLGYTTIKSRKT